MENQNTAPAISSLPWSLHHSQCEDVYGGQQHYSIDSDPRCHVVADLELGMSDEARANGEFIVRACNSHAKMLEALEDVSAALEDFYKVDHMAAGENFGRELLIRIGNAIALAKGNTFDTQLTDEDA